MQRPFLDLIHSFLVDLKWDHLVRYPFIEYLVCTSQPERARVVRIENPSTLDNNRCGELLFAVVRAKP
jgi:hypothetical protein